jgi:hypothetical protein
MSQFVIHKRSLDPCTIFTKRPGRFTIDINSGNTFLNQICSRGQRTWEKRGLSWSPEKDAGETPCYVRKVPPFRDDGDLDTRGYSFICHITLHPVNLLLASHLLPLFLE